MAQYVGHPGESVLLLTHLGAPLLGVLYSSVTVKFRRAGESSFTFKTLAAPDWTEIGDGFYALKWSAADLSKQGAFLFVYSGGSFDGPQHATFDVDPAPLPFLVPPNVCVVSGSISDLGGKPSQGNTITAHAPFFPVASGSSIISSDVVATVPDFLGNFQLALIQGKTVIVELDRTGARYQIDVPMAPTANFLDLIPPMPN